MTTEILEKADELLKDGQLLFQNKRFSSCISRCYYCVLHAALALLQKHNIQTEKRKHRFAISAFSREFTHRKKWFSKEDIEFMETLYKKRTYADYEIKIFKEHETKKLLDKTEEIYNNIKRLYHEKP